MTDAAVKTTLDAPVTKASAEPENVPSASVRVRLIGLAWAGLLVVPCYFASVVVGFDESRSTTFTIAFVVASWTAAVGLAVIATRVTVRLLVRRAMTRFGGAIAQGDPIAARVAAAGVASFLPPARQDELRLVDGAVLELEESWAECLAVTEAIDASKLVPAAQLVVDDRRARALVRLSRGEEALPIARRIVDDARRSAHPSLARFVETLGVAQLSTGDAAAALASFDETRDRSTNARATAHAAFHRAEALRALGRTDEARAEYDRAIAAHPEGTWGRRARERSSDLAGQAYRRD